MTSIGKKRFRRVLVGLSLLLLLMTFALFVWAPPFRQARTLAEIRQGPYGPSVSSDASNMPNQVRHWLWPYISEIYAVNCSQQRASDRHQPHHPAISPFDDRWLQRLLPEFRNLPDLERLTLCHTAVTDAGLQGISSLDSVRAVDLSHTAITDDAIPELVAMPALEQIDLSATSVTSHGRATLKQGRPGLLIREFDFSKTVPPRLP